MISAKVRVQLVLFVLIALAGVSYVGATYARLDTLVDERGYVVTLRLPTSGGIFTNAEVAYRGVAVGRVSGLHLTDSGVAVKLNIEKTELRIPANTEAVVANRSAIGEQYVDLRPATEDGPYLKDGAVIPAKRATLPPRPEKLLANVNKLLASVPTQSVRTVVDELYAAFRDTGDDMRRILGSARSFAHHANQFLPETASLLSHGNQVLRTQQDLANPIINFSKDLDKVTTQLAESDSDLRRLIDATPKVASQISGLLRDTGNEASSLLANLLTTSSLVTTRTDGLEQVLVAYPMVAGMASTAVNPAGFGHLGINLQIFDPPVCTTGGYERTQRRPGEATADVPANNNAYCALGPGHPTGVRGAQNVPVAGKPVQAPGGGRESGQGNGAAGTTRQGTGTTLRQLLGLTG